MKFDRSFLIGIFMGLSLITFAQSRTISGTILDSETNSGLPGVTIAIKGAGTGTQTDELGNFSLQASSGDVLLISFIGFASQEILISDQNNLTLLLIPETQNLDEVVVIGYGTQSRRNITSAIAKLDNNVLANAPRANVGSALQGSLPGLQVVNLSGQPGAIPYILLRGGASINNPGAPLVVVAQGVEVVGRHQVTSFGVVGSGARCVGRR